MTRILAILIALTLASHALAAGEGRSHPPMVYSGEDAAISGYDPVAYFTLGRPVRGNPDIALVWKRAEWWFATPRNRALFEANPRAYAPQYGGYCAFSMAAGQLSTSAPDAWLIRDGRLYLVHNRDVFEIWARDVPGYVARADRNWPAALQK